MFDIPHIVLGNRLFPKPSFPDHREAFNIHDLLKFNNRLLFEGFAIHHEYGRISCASDKQGEADGIVWRAPGEYGGIPDRAQEFLVFNGGYKETKPAGIRRVFLFISKV